MITRKEIAHAIRLLKEIRATLPKTARSTPSPQQRSISLAPAIRAFLDNQPGATFDLSSLVTELRASGVVPPAIKRGDQFVKSRLDGIGDYLRITGSGKGTTYLFRKPSLLSPSPSIPVTF